MLCKFLCLLLHHFVC
uniref:Uncharacterized protein n=1 Tax=Arundo donax TaxID=35708 RepID=A0A0A9B7N5_ARUDO